jgi:hypothetical protein
MAELAAEVKYYEATQAPTIVREVLNPPRGPSRSVPGLDWDTEKFVKNALFERYGLENYIGCVTAEMTYGRPVPHVFPLTETAALTQLYEEEIAPIHAYLFALMKPPTQAYTTESRLGWPFFDRPEDSEPPQSRRSRLLPIFNEILDRQSLDFLKNCFIINNVRLQAEPLTKKRTFLFLEEDGSVFEHTVTKEDRAVDLPTGEIGYASRTRIIFNMPILNLLMQIFDTAEHNAMLEFPIFHHNMYSPEGTLPVIGAMLAADVKHFERHTAEICRRRAKRIGGIYGAGSELFTNAPFACRARNSKAVYWLRVLREHGLSDQFASGLSAVTTAQKEVFLCLFVRFARDVLGIPRDRVIPWVLNGGDASFTIRNYGDDNAWSGDPKKLTACMEFMSQYLAIEEEVPPKFLGFVWQDGRWQLPLTSYLLKTYLNERSPYDRSGRIGTRFRQYPFFGWVEKRKVYAEHGDPRLRNEVFAFENSLLEQVGLPWATVLEEARIQAQQLGEQDAYRTNPKVLLGKEWMLTARERIEAGLAEGLYPGETGPMLKAMVGDETKRWFKW